MTDLYLRGNLTRGGQSSSILTAVDDMGAVVQSPRYQYLAARGKVFSFAVAAVTVTVNASNLVSVCSLYNPSGSNVMAEILDVEAHAVVATTVVNALGVYFQNGSLVEAATFTTRSNAIINGRLGEGQTPALQAYSALTHSGTPALAAIVGGWGAVTDPTSCPTRKDFSGSLVIPPRTIVSLAMTTAASTATGVTMQIRWAEVPYVAM
jgi:hypothetical protein